MYACLYLLYIIGENKLGQKVVEILLFWVFLALVGFIVYMW